MMFVAASTMQSSTWNLSSSSIPNDSASLFTQSPRSETFSISLVTVSSTVRGFMRPSGPSHPESEPFALVAPGLHRTAPLEVREVPADRFPKARLEVVPRRPAQLLPDLARVDGVPPVVARPVGDERLQLVVAD